MPHLTLNYILYLHPLKNTTYFRPENPIVHFHLSIFVSVKPSNANLFFLTTSISSSLFLFPITCHVPKQFTQNNLITQARSRRHFSLHSSPVDVLPTSESPDHLVASYEPRGSYSEPVPFVYIIIIIIIIIIKE